MLDFDSRIEAHLWANQQNGPCCVVYWHSFKFDGKTYYVLVVYEYTRRIKEGIKFREFRLP